VDLQDDLGGLLRTVGRVLEVEQPSTLLRRMSTDL
jgi:hypothetical protein